LPRSLFRRAPGIASAAVKNSAADGAADGGANGGANGLTNLQEYLAGTDPSDPGEYLKIDDLQNTATTVTVTWPAVPGRNYTVFWSTDLQTWTADSVYTATTTSQSATLNKAVIDNVDGIPGNLTELFIRVKVQAP